MNNVIIFKDGSLLYNDFGTMFIESAGSMFSDDVTKRGHMCDLVLFTAFGSLIHNSAVLPVPKLSTAHHTTLYDRTPKLMVEGRLFHRGQHLLNLLDE